MREEKKMTPPMHHTMILEDRAALTLSGVTDVDCFDERVINLYTQLGELTIKGRNLHIDAVSVETGDMKIQGDIWALQYGDRDKRGPLTLLASAEFSTKHDAMSAEYRFKRLGYLCLPAWQAFRWACSMTVCAFCVRSFHMGRSALRRKISSFCCFGASN